MLKRRFMQAIEDWVAARYRKRRAREAGDRHAFEIAAQQFDRTVHWRWFDPAYWRLIVSRGETSDESDSV